MLGFMAAARIARRTYLANVTVGSSFRLRVVPEPQDPTRDDVDAIVGPATPHFAYQLAARLRELVAGLPSGHEVRRYADEQLERLDRLAYASSKADEGPRESPARLGWDEIPSSAPADEPLPRNT
jgi:hypothetical protein